MAQYQYKALTAQGKRESGRRAAASRSELTERLKEEKLFVTEITKVDETASGGGLNADVSLSFFNNVSKKEVLFFFSQLSVLIRSGLSIVRALTVIHRQSRGRRMRNVVGKIRTAVEEGSDLSIAMKASGQFTDYDIGMVAAGEESGELGEILQLVADRMQKNMELKSLMITSMIYPSALIVVSTAVMIGISVFVVPKVSAILAGRGQSLPQITRIMLGVSDWMVAYWKRVVLGIIGFVVGVVLLKKTESGAAVIDRILLRVPVVGHVIKTGIIVNFTRNLSILTRSGVALSEAMLSIKKTITNSVGKAIIGDCYDAILQGEGLSDTLRKHERIFYPMVVEMVATGEETGSMEEVLDIAGEQYQKTLEVLVKRLNVILEPIILVVIGGVVGFTITALMLGVLSMYDM